MEKITFEIPERYKDLYVVGDIHGEFETLVWNLSEKYKIENAVIVIAGDCGIGFENPKYYENLYNKISKKLEKHNLLLLGIRGNHDDPLYFNGALALNFDRLKTLKDYTFLKISGKELLCVGGAISLDREWRLIENKKLSDSGSTKRCWWKNEGPTELDIQEINKLPGRIYGMISHESPISFDPTLIRDENIQKEIFLGISKSRKYLEQLEWKCRPYRWYYGHYHKSMSGTNGVTQFRCLDIQEIIRIPFEEDFEIKENPDSKKVEE